MPVKAEPALLWRRTFDAPIVKTSNLSDFKATEDRISEVPLKTVMTKENLFILDSQGNIAKEIPLKDYQKVTTSDSGMMLATIKDREVSILNIDNQIQDMVSISDPLLFKLPQRTVLELSPNGQYLIIMPYFGKNIYFYNKRNKTTSKHQFEDLRGAEVAFSGNSSYAVVHIPNWGEGKTNGYILFFNEKGKKLWQFEHKGYEAKFDISSDGNFIALATEERLYSLNKNGKVIYAKELKPGGIDIALSDDGKYIAITRTADHTVSLLDNRNGELLWSYTINGFDPINSPFTSLDVSSDGNNIAVAISKDWTRTNKESFLYLFDKSGSIVWQKTFEENRINCSLSPDGRCILVRGNKEAYLYRN